MEYQPWEIEKKWLEYWKKHNTYKVENHSSLPKYYVLDMFPYPSGSGLHVGHPLGYIASDIYARYKRMKGYNVLHPMGFDAFGLPAEQFAIQTGKHPAITTTENINRYKQQLESIGFCYDWSREINTSDPRYYRWTQWIFMQLFNAWYDNQLNKARPINELITIFETQGNLQINAATSCNVTFHADTWKQLTFREQQQILMQYRLAYQSYADVNWCEALGTVLANDEVVNGVSVRGGYPVEKRPMRQWFLRITAYAERLLEGLNHVDFPESLKEMQRNWIGKSEGALIKFELEQPALPSDNNEPYIEVFTTRPDTIFGVTFMVLAPEHPLVTHITIPTQREDVENYLRYVRSRSERERQAEVKTVSGAFTGSYVIHPFTRQPIPVWIGEYVLMGYGTGAIMAVPADDTRDRAFAEKFGLPIIDIIDKSNYPGATIEDKVGKLINSDFLNGLEVTDAIEKVIKLLEEKGMGKRKVHYRMRDAGFSRQRYWGEPFPVIYKNGIPCLIDEKELPLELPPLDDFKPTGTGESPLSKIKEWVNLPDGSKRETDTMPGYAGSSWYFLRYMDPHNESAFVGKEAQQYWRDVDLYVGGAEHAVGHLLYARFWHKFFFDMGWVCTDEPFRKLINQGMIQGRSNFVYKLKNENKFVSYHLKNQYEVIPLHVDIYIVDNDILDLEKFKVMYPEYADAEFILEEDGKYHCGWEIEKMSKSKYNVVNPDDVIDQYGADTFRMYEMFLGPIEQSKPWNMQGIDGVFKFIKKFWRLFYNDKGILLVNNTEPSPAEWKILHRTIKKVSEDIERFSFNTCISTFMICVNELKELNCSKRAILEPLVRLMAPFAPFICEELWQNVLLMKGSVHTASYPQYDAGYLEEDTFEYPISVNGKLRAKISLSLKATREEIEPIVLSHPVIQKWLNTHPPKKIVFVPGRMINIVV